MKNILTTSAAVGQIFSLLNADSCPIQVEIESGSQSAENLSNVLYVDKHTSVALADQNGNIESPFGTLTAAVAAAADGYTIIICSGDYTTEGTITLPRAVYLETVDSELQSAAVGHVVCSSAMSYSFAGLNIISLELAAGSHVTLTRVTTGAVTGDGNITASDTVFIVSVAAAYLSAQGGVVNGAVVISGSIMRLIGTQVAAVSVGFATAGTLTVDDLTEGYIQAAPATTVNATVVVISQAHYVTQRVAYVDPSCTLSSSEQFGTQAAPYSTIGAAVARLGSGGGTVYVAPGSYGSTPVAFPDGSTYSVISQGCADRIVLPPTTAGTATISVRGCVVHHTGGYLACYDCLVLGCTTLLGASDSTIIHGFAASGSWSSLTGCQFPAPITITLDAGWSACFSACTFGAAVTVTFDSATGTIDFDTASRYSWVSSASTTNASTVTIMGVPSTGYAPGDIGKYLAVVAGGVVGLVAGGSGSLENLPTTRYVSSSTTVPSGSQVGNIEAPFATIQAAVDDLAATGGVIIVEQGNYLETVDVSAVAANLAIQAINYTTVDQDVAGVGTEPQITAITSGSSVAAITLTLAGLAVSTVTASGIDTLALASTNISSGITTPGRLVARDSILHGVNAANLYWGRLQDCQIGSGEYSESWAPTNHCDITIYHTEIFSAVAFTFDLSAGGNIWLDVYTKNYFSWYACSTTGGLYIIDETWPTYNLYVDPQAVALATPDGSPEHPFTTAQQAVDYVVSLGTGTYGGVSITIGEGNAGNVVLEASYLYALSFSGPGSIQNLQSTTTNTQLYWLTVDCGLQGTVNLVGATGFCASGCRIRGVYFRSAIVADLGGGEMDLIDCSNTSGSLTFSNGYFVLQGGNGYTGPLVTSGAYVYVHACVLTGNIAVTATDYYRFQCGARVGESEGSFSIASGGQVDSRGPTTIHCAVANSGSLITYNTTIAGGVSGVGTWVNYSDAYNALDPTKWATAVPTAIEQAINRIAAVVGAITPIP